MIKKIKNWLYIRKLKKSDRQIERGEVYEYDNRVI